MNKADNAKPNKTSTSLQQKEWQLTIRYVGFDKEEERDNAYDQWARSVIKALS